MIEGLCGSATLELGGGGTLSGEEQSQSAGRRGAWPAAGQPTAGQRPEADSQRPEALHP